MKRCLIAGVLISLILVSCSNDPKTGAPENTADTTVYRVKTLVLEMRDVAQNIEYTATLLPYEEIHYAPASPGRIEQIYVQVGSRVRRGSLIARMDQTQLATANEQLQSARNNFQRMDTLHKLHSISEQVWEAAKTQYEIAKTTVAYLSRNTSLVSPINGIVTGKYYERGEMYSGAPNTPAGKAAIVTLMQIHPLKAKINISERYFPLIKQGMQAGVKADLYPDKNIAAQVLKVYPTISADSRTFPVELSIPNPDETLRPGMFARVSLDLGQIKALIVPAIAIVKQEGTNNRYVFIAGNDKTARKIKVETGARFDDQLEIISDEVKVGDQIIVAGQNKLMDGSRILIVNETGK